MGPHPLPPFMTSKDRHTPLPPDITGPHLAAQVSRSEVFIRSSPVPTKSQRLCYSRKEGSATLGNTAQVLSQSASYLPTGQLIFRRRKCEGGRDKSLQEDCDSELITSAREFLG